MRYAKYFEWLAYASVEEVAFRFGHSDVGFYLVSRAFAEFGGARGAFAGWAVLLVGAVIYASRRVTPASSLVTLGIFALLPSLYALGTNVLRQGAAMSLILIGLGVLMGGRRVFGYSIMALAVPFHETAILFLVAVFLASRLSVKICLSVLVVSSVLSMFSFGLHQVDMLTGTDFVSKIFGDRFGKYVNHSYGYEVGFRFDFFVYTVAPMLVSLLAMMHEKSSRQMLRFLTNIYIILSSVFFLSFQYAFSDRVAIYAWMISPFILSVSIGSIRVKSWSGIFALLIASAFILVNIVLMIS